MIYYEVVSQNRCEVEEQNVASFDAGWQSRGSGTNYASLSGTYKCTLSNLR